MRPLGSLDALWEKAVKFHGHSCPGLALGCRVAHDALLLLGLDSRSEDEEVVCVAETESCAVDAIQVITGCTLGKGNLVLRMRGKHAFTFFARATGGAVRLLWTDTARDLPREERIARYLTALPEALYTVGDARVPMPEKALLSQSLACAACGEMTAEPYVRLRDSKPFCLECSTTRARVIAEATP